MYICIVVVVAPRHLAMPQAAGSALMRINSINLSYVIVCKIT